MKIIIINTAEEKRTIAITENSIIYDIIDLDNTIIAKQQTSIIVKDNIQAKYVCLIVGGGGYLQENRQIEIKKKCLITIILYILTS